MRKHITCVISDLGGGGAEHQMVELTRLLVQHGYDVSILTYVDQDDFYEVAEHVKRIKVAIGKSNLVKVLRLLLKCAFFKTDTFITFSHRTSAFVLFSQILRRKTVVISSDRNLTVGKPDIFERVLMKWLYRRASFIVPNSYSQREHILKGRPEWQNKVKTITNYTDLSLFNPTELPQRDVVRIGVFGRYNRQKNCIRFVEMLRLLKERSQQKFMVEWYGDISMKGLENPEYRKMQQKVEEYGLEDVISLNDHVKDVASVIPSFEVMCLPSVFEGFSNSLSEYICCGRPVVASNVSDNSHMVLDGENGFLFNPFDIEDMCNAFLRYFSLSREQKVIMGRRSREIAEKLFDAETFVNKYIALIENKK